mmetsp:Transcript_11855/g.53507  ORF Transcript_11855/g.53507 Transcript_11855/m.53507 type:complete len:270 (+) Transcript_11855:621-1430(+)
MLHPAATKTRGGGGRSCLASSDGARSARTTSSPSTSAPSVSWCSSKTRSSPTRSPGPSSRVARNRQSLARRFRRRGGADVAVVAERTKKGGTKEGTEEGTKTNRRAKAKTNRRAPSASAPPTTAADRTGSRRSCPADTTSAGARRISCSSSPRASAGTAGTAARRRAWLTGSAPCSNGPTRRRIPSTRFTAREWARRTGWSNPRSFAVAGSRTSRIRTTETTRTSDRPPRAPTTTTTATTTRRRRTCSRLSRGSRPSRGRGRRGTSTCG